MAEKIDSLLEHLCGDPSSCRERLLHTAGMLFAEHGVEAVSTRQLTKAANVNLSAIGYYFGGKEQLYNEALDYTIQLSQDLLGGIEQQLRADVAAAAGDRAKLAAAAARFAHDLICALLLGIETWPKRLIMREIDQPTEAFERLFENVFRPLNEAFRELVVAATGKPGDAPETVILTSALLGECLVFHRNQPIVLRALGWDDYTPERVEAITAVVTDGILDALDLPRTDLPKLKAAAEAAA